MMPPFVVFPTNRIAHFVEVSLYLFYLAQRVNLRKSSFSILVAWYLHIGPFISEGLILIINAEIFELRLLAIAPASKLIQGASTLSLVRQIIP